MKKIFKFFFIFSLIFICTSLTGCSDKSLIAEDVIIEDIETNIPNARFIHSINEKSDNQFGENIYYFTTGDFEFEVKNKMHRDVIFPINKNEVTNNYLYKLIQYKKDDIIELTNKHNIVFDGFNEKMYYNDDFEQLLKDNKNEIVFRELSSELGRNVSIELFIGNFDKMDVAFDFLNDLEKLFEEYMPNTIEKYSTNSISYKIISTHQYLEKDTYDPKIFASTKHFMKGNFEIDKIMPFVEHEFAYLVRTQEISDEGLTYDESLEYNPIIINRLFINDEEYIDTENDISFIYNVEDDKYYISLSYGTEFTYGDGTTDGIQRNIIEKYYSNSNYELDSDKRVSSYTINDNNYKIEFTRDDKDFEFSKNRNKLHINTLSQIGNRSAGSEYKKFISVNDFAELMEMNLVKIDFIGDEGVIYLEKR